MPVLSDGNQIGTEFLRGRMWSLEVGGVVAPLATRAGLLAGGDVAAAEDDEGDEDERDGIGGEDERGFGW